MINLSRNESPDHDSVADDLHENKLALSDRKKNAHQGVGAKKSGSSSKNRSVVGEKYLKSWQWTKSQV